MNAETRTVTYSHVIILAAGETPDQHSCVTGELEGPYTGESTEAVLAELARDCDESLSSERVQWWERDGVLWVAPRGAAPVVTIDGTAFTAQEIEDGMVWDAARNTTKASNSGYHRMGQPGWWARIGNHFLPLPRTRADSPCPDVNPQDVITAIKQNGGSGAQLVIGYGPKDSKDARRFYFNVTAH